MTRLLSGADITDSRVTRYLEEIKAIAALYLKVKYIILYSTIQLHVQYRGYCMYSTCTIIIISIVYLHLSELLGTLLSSSEASKLYLSHTKIAMNLINLEFR